MAITAPIGTSPPSAARRASSSAAAIRSATVSGDGGCMQVDFSHLVPNADGADRPIARSRKSPTGTSLARHQPAMPKRTTVRRSLVLDAGLDKLQTFLLSMGPGDELSVRRAVEISGLD